MTRRERIARMERMKKRERIPRVEKWQGERG